MLTRAPAVDGRWNGVALEAVRLLEVEPELAGGLSGDELAAARAAVVVPAVNLPQGPWQAPARIERCVGAVVLSGLMVYDGHAFGRPAPRVFGSGDLVDVVLLADAASPWRVLEPAGLALLDGRFVHAMRRWPELVTSFTRRAFDAQREMHAMATIAAMPRVEDRLLACLAHHGSRWGRIGAEGLILSLPVTHEFLGRLIGAQRPTVTLALATLREEGVLGRLDDGRWVLPVDCVDWSVTGLPERAAAG